jgi:hypothetical protein
MDNSNKILSPEESRTRPEEAKKQPSGKRFRGNRIVDGSLPISDGRSGWPRLARDTFRRLLIHCGGDASEAQRILARRIATLEAVLIYLEEDFAVAYASGGRPDPALLALYGTLADRQRRLAEPLGWQRTARDVTDKAAEPVQWVIVDPAPPSENDFITEGHSDPSETE